MVNEFSSETKGAVDYSSLKSNANGMLYSEMNYTIENGNQIVNADGLTLQEVYDALIIILGGDLNLVRKVLLYSKAMAACGVHVAQESKLSKHDVHELINNLRNQLIHTKKIGLLHNMNQKNIKLKKNRESLVAGR